MPGWLEYLFLTRKRPKTPIVKRPEQEHKPTQSRPIILPKEFINKATIALRQARSGQHVPQLKTASYLKQVPQKLPSNFKFLPKNKQLEIIARMARSRH